MHDFKEYFINIENLLASIVPDRSWTDKEAVIKAFNTVRDSFDGHYQRASHDLEYIFSGDHDPVYQTDKTVKLLEDWENGNNIVSLPSMMALCIEKMRLDDPYSVYTQSLFVASILAEVNNDCHYHNNMHFRKVILHVIRMIVAHNNIISSSKNCLNKAEITMLLLSSAIHDLGHQGKGNIIDRKYYMAKTEKRSFDLASPYLKAAGLTQSILDDILVMIMATDVSPFGDPISPANQVRRAYGYHYGSLKEDRLDLANDLSLLKDRCDLTLMCMMLHEADIMNSAGVSYGITCGESVAVSREMKRVHASPEDTLLFLEKICSGEFLTDSARYLGSANLAKILSRVISDYKDGNKSYM